MVKMIRPRIVEQAIESDRLQEMVVEALMKKHRQQSKAMTMGTSHQGGKGFNQERIVNNPGAKQSGVPHPTGRFNDQRRQPGMCFRCGDKYFPRHQCRQQILLLEGDSGDAMEGGEETEECEELGEEENGEI